MDFPLLISSIHLPGSLPGGGYLCEAACTKWGIPDSLVPGTVISIPNRGSMGTAWSVLALLGHRSMCLGLPCKGLRINRLSASHRYPRLLNQSAMISLNDGTM
jgi:hypothetical protein